MKNALILHGTGDNSKKNWFGWLQQELEKKSFTVWTPDLPQSDTPNIDRYNEFIFSNKEWEFNNESILIGHSSGAVAIFGILEALPTDRKVDTCYLVGAFKNDLGWESLSQLFEKPFNFEKIKTKANHFVFIHSDNDPYCPLEHAQYLSTVLGGELLVKKGQKHFSVGTAGEHYTQFPFLLDFIIRSYTK